MPRGRFHIIVLAIALLFANAWCVAQCIVTPTPAHVPPCHRHQSVKACASSVAIEVTNDVPQSQLAVLLALPVSQRDYALPVLLTESSGQAVSPPPPRIATPILA